jgi:hypothetical protein
MEIKVLVDVDEAGVGEMGYRSNGCGGTVVKFHAH